MRYLIFVLVAVVATVFGSVAHSGGHAGYGEGVENWAPPATFPLTSKTGRYSYPATEGSGGPLSIEWIFDGITHHSEIVFYNTLTGRGAVEDLTFVDEVTGLSVHVAIEYGGGDDPDVMTVTPPPGYVAIPTQLSVEEYTSGTIKIYEILLG